MPSVHGAANYHKHVIVVDHRSTWVKKSKPQYLHTVANTVCVAPHWWSWGEYEVNVVLCLNVIGEKVTKVVLNVSWLYPLSKTSWPLNKCNLESVFPLPEQYKSITYKGEVGRAEEETGWAEENERDIVTGPKIAESYEANFKKRILKQPLCCLSDTVNYPSSLSVLPVCSLQEDCG